MTTIVSIKGEKGIIIGADSQVTLGHLKKSGYHKIQTIGDSVLIGSAGSVGMSQQITRRTLQQKNIERVLSEEEFKLSASDFSRAMADTLFDLSLKFPKAEFRSASFIICDESHIFEVDDSGARIPIEDYTAIGSGMELALSHIAQNFDPKADLKDLAILVNEALSIANKLDCYTDNRHEIFIINRGGDIQQLVEKVENKKQLIETKT